MEQVFDSLHTELFESVKMGLAICDMEGKLCYVNQAYADLIGHSKAAVYQLSYWDITPESYSEQEQQQLALLESQGEYGPYDKEYIHKDKTRIPVRLHGKIVTIDGVQYIWSTVEDIRFSKSKETQLELESKSQLIEESLNEIFLFNIDSLKFVYVNDSGRNNIGYEESELLEMTPINIQPDYSLDKFEAFLKPLRDGEVNVLLHETRHRRKDGSEYYVQTRIHRSHYLGQPVFAAFVLDISLKRGMELHQQSVLEELDRSYQFLKAINDNAAYAIIAATPDGLITSFNRAAELMLGYKASELLNQQTPALFHIEEEVIAGAQRASRILGRTVEPGFKSFVALSDENLPNEYEWTYVHKNGKKFPVLLSITSLRDSEGNVTGYMGMASDITDRKEREQELQIAKENAEKASAIKSEFLANMSHEIRTPMNGIIGMTTLLEEEVENNEVKEKLKIVKTSANSLLGIINDILDLSKIEAGKIILEKERFHLKNLVSDIIEIHRASIDGSELKLKLFVSPNVPDLIIGDELRVRQVLNNLISNAIKFTQIGKVEIHLEASVQDNHLCEIFFKISDTGIGISEEDQAKLFQSFSQADASTTRRFGGTGLGLVISKNLVKLMGGKISVESNPNDGSTFSFNIVAEIPGEENTTIETDKGSSDLPQGKLAILVVEDNIVNQQVVKGFLKKFDYHIDFAVNGEEALDKLENVTYDIIFMDCNMPIMDGFTATEQIINIYGEDRPFIVALTASSMEADIQKCYAAGMDEFIAKPFSKNDLTRVLGLYQKKYNQR